MRPGFKRCYAATRTTAPAGIFAFPASEFIGGSRVDIGRLRWMMEHHDLTGQSMGKLISDYSSPEKNPERTILHLTLSGVVEPHRHARIDELKEIVEKRYHAGSSLGADDVLIEPNAEQLAEVVGPGVLKRVLERLKNDSPSRDVATNHVSNHTLKLLYRIAWEEQPK